MFMCKTQPYQRHYKYQIINSVKMIKKKIIYDDYRWQEHYLYR